MTRRKSGFTMIEMLIIIGIIALIGAVTLTRLPALRFQTRVKISAQNMLLAVRQARQYSSAGREFRKGTGVYPSYGVYFDRATPDRVILFADCVADDNGNGTIDNGDNFTYRSSSTSCAGGNGNVQTVLLDKGITIKAIRTFASNPSSGVSQNRSAVEYLRPLPETWISDANSVPIGLGGLAIDIADSTNGWKKTLVIWITGDAEIL